MTHLLENLHSPEFTPSFWARLNTTDNLALQTSAQLLGVIYWTLQGTPVYLSAGFAENSDVFHEFLTYCQKLRDSSKSLNTRQSLETLVIACTRLLHFANLSGPTRLVSFRYAGEQKPRRGGWLPSPAGTHSTTSGTDLLPYSDPVSAGISGPTGGEGRVCGALHSNSQPKVGASGDGGRRAS